MSRIDSRVARDEFLTFRLGEEEYAIDILQVQEIRAHETVTRIASAPGYVKGVINLRGTIVPIVDLRVKLRMPRIESAGVSIILDLGGRVVGVLVDAVSDVVALARDEIRAAPELGALVDARFIRGIAPLGERLLVLVDIARLMTEGELAAVDRAAA